MSTRRKRVGTGGASSRRKKGYADPRKKVPTGGMAVKRRKGRASRR